MSALRLVSPQPLPGYPRKPRDERLLHRHRRVQRARLTEIVRDLVSRELPPPIDDERARAVMEIYEEAKSRLG